APARAQRRERVAGGPRRRARSLVPVLALAPRRPAIAARGPGSAERLDPGADRGGVGGPRRQPEIALVGAHRLGAEAEPLARQAEAAPRRRVRRGGVGRLAIERAGAR